MMAMYSLALVNSSFGPRIWALAFSNSSVVVRNRSSWFPLCLCSSSIRSTTPETCSPSHRSHCRHVPCWLSAANYCTGSSLSSFSPLSLGVLSSSSFSGSCSCRSCCCGLRPCGNNCSISGSGWPADSSFFLPTGSSLSWVSPTTIRAGSSACCFQSCFFGRRSMVSAGSSSASSSVVSWRILCTKSSCSQSCLQREFNRLLSRLSFSTASCVWLVCLAGLSGAFSAGSCLRLVCTSSRCDESSGVHPGVCFSKSFRLFVAFFGVVSGQPRFFGWMASSGGH